MKRNLFLFGAVALFSLVACSRVADRETVTPSPYFDEATNTVRTDFILNVSTNTGKDTKTTAEFVQNKTDFLGMDEVHILAYNLPYTTAAKGSYFYKPYYYNPETGETEAVAAERDFNLGMLFNPKAVTDESASRTVELALPLGTNAVALYGKALKSYSDDLQGKIVANGNPVDLTTLTFTLQPRLTSLAKFEAGAFFFTRMLTYFTSTGLVDEGHYWDYTPISDKNLSYGFWWPVPTAASAAKLPENPADGQVEVVEDDPTEYTYYAGEFTWKHLGVMEEYETDDNPATKSGEVVTTKNGTKIALSPLGQVLGDAYQKLTVIVTQAGLHEIRAGSAAALLRTMQDLYSIIERASNASPTGWEENIVKLLAQQIEDRMRRFFVVSTDGEIDFIQKAGAVDVATLKSVIASCTTTDDWNANKSIVNTHLDADYFSSATSEGFPINVGLPHGAAALICNVEAALNKLDVFYYTTNIPAYGMGEVTFPIGSYRYPAELMYFGNSPIRVTTEEKKAGQYPSTVSLWDNEAQWSAWDTFASVRSDTRSVAMVNNINYGTALLASTVKFGATTLKDNNHALHELEEDQSVPTSYDDPDEGFFVTGIIVGGQADVMGWDYVRHPSNISYTGISVDENGKFTGLSFEGNGFDKMVYDKVTTSYKVGTTTEPIYTMLWDNYDHTKNADDQSDVYVGVELVNNTGMDFWGELNLIRKGGTFYLVGKLDLSDAVAAARAGDGNQDKFTDLSRKYYNYPPYNPADGTTINAPRVFMQDYMTKANLIIGENALKHAYVTVPDLRSSQISLGVSIDMEWESGLAFDVVLGGE